MCALTSLALAQSEQPKPHTVRPPAGIAAGIEEQISEKVSLSPDQVVGLLRREPGLLLEAKKILVRKAYEQGRLLEEADLTDEALFRLVYRDSTIRALITQQITRRRYVQPLPTPEEYAEQRRAEQNRARVTREASLTNEATDTGRQPALGMETKRSESSRKPRQTEPGKPNPDPSQRDRLNSPDVDPRDRTMPSVRPEDLPQLLETAHPATGDRDDETQSRPIFNGGEGTPLPGAGAADLYRNSELATNARSNPASVETEGSREYRRPPEFPRTRIYNPRILRQEVPYSGVPALRDLYSQVQPSPRLVRFGADIFENGAGNVDDLPMDLPLDPDYVLGPGDGITIEVWGGISQRLQRVVDREGKVGLPEVGTVMVAGKSLGAVQTLLQSELRREFQDVRVDVSVARLRSIRVYVVGDVKAPGPYEISSISSPLNAIFMAGGPTERGSIRTIKHYRGKQLIQEVDSYDLILHGTTDQIKRLQAGDTVLVPPIGPEITIEGMVRRPAIYELKSEKNLEQALALAGGPMSSAFLGNIEIERLDPHRNRSMFSLAVPETDDAEARANIFRAFQIKEGDKIRISAIPAYSERSIYLDGHVYRPGKYAFVEGMKVGDLLKRSGDMLPEPYFAYAEIVRAAPPVFRPQVLSFNLGEALAGDTASNIELQPFDTVRIYGRFDFEDAPKVVVTGEVREPGEHRISGDMSLRDAVFAAGGVTPNALLADAQIFRQSDGRTQILSVDLKRALEGDANNNIALLPRDRVLIHKNLARLDPPAVYIHGQVANPGKYPLGEQMTLTQLVRLAGGFKRGAYTEKADLSRSIKREGERIETERSEVNLAQAFSDRSADRVLQDGDTISVRQITGFNDLGASIRVDGEVLHASTYGITEGERLSSILLRAGGFRPGAYPQGAVLERVQVREIEERMREDLVRRLEEEEQSLKVTPNLKPQEELSFRQAFFQQQSLILSKLKGTPPIGRVVVRLTGNIADWQNTASDIEVRAGDIITIPKRPNHVLVSGQVYNPTAVSYRPGKSARWYLAQAGGATDLGNRKNIFVIRADGSVVGSGGGVSWWAGDPLDKVLNPGDAIVVPEKILTGNSILKSLAETAQIVSAVAIAASVALR